jgi:hypothetical protein
MRPQQIESWAHQVIEDVEKKQYKEDIRVELKTVWPSDNLNKVARQLGAHANAARGEPVLWLLGVDEKAGTVPGVIPDDFANSTVSRG